MRESEVARRFTDAIEESLVPFILAHPRRVRGLFLIDLAAIPDFAREAEITADFEVGFVPIDEVMPRIARQPDEGELFLSRLTMALQLYCPFTEAIVLIRFRDAPRFYRVLSLT